jgi:flagellar export protein FliJ
MRRLIFRFQRVLELKGRFEEEKRGALGVAMAVFNREQGRLQSLEHIQLCRLQDDVGLGGVLDPAALRVDSDYGLRLEREVIEQQERLRRAGALVEEKRQIWMEARKERRTFEVLKERALIEHRRAVNRQERIVLDEIGGQRHLRRGSERGEA